MPFDLTCALWEHSRAKGSELLLLLAIARKADIEGKALASISDLAKNTRLTTRNVQLLIRKLEKIGELSVTVGEGFRGQYIYELKTFRDEAKFIASNAKSFVGKRKKITAVPIKDEDWPGLVEMILQFELPLDPLNDNEWWNDISWSCNNPSNAWLTREFAKMHAWRKENPLRAPRTGWKRFVRGWLERTYAQERKTNGRST